MEQLPTYLRSIRTSTRVGRCREVRAGWESRGLYWSTAYLTRAWTAGKIKPLLLNWWALSIYSKRGAGRGGAGQEGAVQHRMKSTFGWILLKPKPHAFQLNLQSKQTSLGSLILITQWISAVPALLYQFARYFQPGTEVFMQLRFKAARRGGSGRGCRVFTDALSLWERRLVGRGNTFL